VLESCKYALGLDETILQTDALFHLTMGTIAFLDQREWNMPGIARLVEVEGALVGKIFSYCFIASTGFMERHKQIGKNLAEGVTRREEFG